MFDRALRKVPEVGSYTFALASVDDVRKFMEIRFMVQFVRHELISQQEADEIYDDQEEKVSVLGMTWVKHNQRILTSYEMPKWCCVKYP